MKLSTLMTDLTRRPLTAALAAVAGLALGTAPATAQDFYDEHYEWEPGEGVHEEEWYDPSDWFDDDWNEQRVDYETDWWDYDYYDDYGYDYGPYDYDYYDEYGYDYDPYEYDYYDEYGYDYDDDYYYDDYGYEYDDYYGYDYGVPEDEYYDIYRGQAQAQRETQGQYQRQAAETTGQRQQQQMDRAQGRRQMAQGQDQQIRQGESAELRGQLDGWSRVNLQGQRDAHTLVRLRLQDGQTAVVNLGPNVSLQRLNLAQGDRVAVWGQRGKIDGREVLMAKRIRAGQQTITMDDGRQAGQQRQARTQNDQRRMSGGMQGRQQADRQQMSEGQSGRSASFQQQSRQPRQMQPDSRRIQQLISQWSSESQRAARSMLERYGQPDAVSNELLVWNNTGPFVKTIVHSRAVDHDFPVPHQDVLEQFVNYKVPADKMDELATFDGSIIVYRTDGLMSARCHKEAMNILALNLAHDILQGEKSVQEARQAHARTASQYAQGQRSQATQRLSFNTSSRNTDQPDAPGQRFRQSSRSSSN